MRPDLEPRRRARRCLPSEMLVGLDLVSREACGRPGERVEHIELIGRCPVFCGLVGRCLDQQDELRARAASRECGVAPLLGVMMGQRDDHGRVDCRSLGEVPGDRVGVLEHAGLGLGERYRERTLVGRRDRDGFACDGCDVSSRAVCDSDPMIVPACHDDVCRSLAKSSRDAIRCRSGM